MMDLELEDLDFSSISKSVILDKSPSYPGISLHLCILMK